MAALFFSVLLFGLVHPVSKVLLDSGIPLSFFCVSYVGIRLVIQAPILFSHRPTRSVKKTSVLTTLISFGFIGAGLQFFEFKGIDDGLSPGTVTFIMFSYPIWLSLFAFLNPQQKNAGNLAAAFISVLGVLLVTGGSLHEIQHSRQAIIYPFLASIFIALWVHLSNKLRKDGMKTVELSLYYDFFSFVILLILFNKQLYSDFSELKSWLSIHNVLYLFLYSILVGLLPNLFFYFGSKSVTSYTAGLAMAFEPVLSTLYSAILWQHSFTIVFWMGASLIILSNLPIELIFQKTKKRTPCL